MIRRSLQCLEGVAAAHRGVALVMAFLVTLLGAATAGAQASHTNQQYNASFATAGQSLWGPGTAPLSDFNRTLRLVDVSWNVGDTIGDIRSLDTPIGELGFGGEIGAYTSGDFGLFSRFSDVGTGEVAVNYPVQVTLGIPTTNTFRDGQVISIPSSLVLLDGSAISVTPPRGSIDVRGSAAFAAGAHAKVCIFGCTQFPLFPSIDLGNTDVPVLQMGYDGTGASYAQLVGLPRVELPHTLTFLESQLTNLSGTIGLPSVHPTTTVAPGTGARALIAAGSDMFFNVSLDMDGLVTGKIPLGFETPDFHGAHLKYETVDLSTVVKMIQDQTFSFTPTVYATLSFPRAMVWSEEDAGGAVVASGNDAVITFQVGNTLKVTYPAGLKDAMTVTPTFSIRNTFSSDVLNRFKEDIVLTVGQFQLSVPSVEIFPSFTVDVCEGLTVDADPLDIIPDEHCPVTTPAVNSPSISIDLGPLYQQSLFGLNQSMRVFPFAASDCTAGSTGCGHWELQGFNSAPGLAFDLDPENPIIDVATSVVSGLASRTGPAGTLIQTMTVRNLGDVPLSAAQIADALARAVPTGGAFHVRSVNSVVLTENNAFNGVSDLGTLTRADVLAVGGSGVVTVGIDVTPGNVFSSLLDADGTSPIGTNVRAGAAASFAVFAFDIRPTLNSGSNGVLPVVFLSTPGMDAAGIDPASLRLEGVAPLRWSLVPRGTLNDLELKFDRQSVVAGLQQRLAAGPLAAARMQGPDMPSAAQFAGALLGGEALTASQLKAADRNGNGVLDIGDLRALVRNAAVSVAPADISAALAGPPGGGGGGGGLALGASAQSATVILVITGTMRDGTPLMGENAITIKGMGQ